MAGARRWTARVIAVAIGRRPMSVELHARRHAGHRGSRGRTASGVADKATHLAHQHPCAKNRDQQIACLFQEVVALVSVIEVPRRMR